MTPGDVLEVVFLFSALLTFLHSIRTGHVTEWFGILLFAIICETISVHEPIATHSHAQFRIMLLPWLPLKEALWYCVVVYPGWYTAHTAQKKGILDYLRAPFLAGLLIISHDILYECVNAREFVDLVFLNRENKITDLKDTFLEGSTAVISSFMMLSTLIAFVADFGIRNNVSVPGRLLLFSCIYPMMFIAFLPYNFIIKYLGCMDIFLEKGFDFEGETQALRIRNGLMMCSASLSVFTDSVGCAFLGVLYFVIVLSALGHREPTPPKPKQRDTITDPSPWLCILPVLLTNLVFLYLLIFVHGLQSGKVQNRDRHLFSTGFAFLLFTILTLHTRYQIHYNHNHNQTPIPTNTKSD